MPIDYEKKDHIRIMTFNNLEKRNALTTKDFLRMEQIEEESKADPERKPNFKGI